MNVAIKKLNKNAKLPAYGSEYAAGADLYACLDMPVVIAPGRTKVIPTGIALELPVGYAGLIYARSGLATKQGLAPANKVGVVDCDYRGEVMVALHNHSGEARTVAEATERVGLSRSAFYKYKDAVMPFREMRRGSIVTFHALLRDRKGVLSSLLAIFADTGANILTINQSIPTNGTALVTISATTENMPIGTDELITKARELEGVLRFDALAG